MNLDEIRNFRNGRQFNNLFDEERACREFIEQVRWKGNVTCLLCGCTKVYRLSYRPGFKCSKCTKKFSLYKGTFFEETKLPLWKWFRAIYAFKGAKGVCCKWLEEELGVSHETAWFMIQRMQSGSQIKFEDIPTYENETGELDETYNGANRTKQSGPRKKLERNPDGGGYCHRWAIYGILVRGKRVFCFFQPPSVTADTVKSITTKVLGETCTVYSDMSKVYAWMKNYYARNVQFDHKKHHYGNNKEEHSNEIEGFWEKAKTFVRGTYRHVTYKYGARYFNEIASQYSVNNFHQDILELDRKPTKIEKFIYAFETLGKPITLAELKRQGQENKKQIDDWREEQKAKKQKNKEIKIARDKRREERLERKKISK